MRDKLLNIVIEYDRKQSKQKHYNRYALALYCKAVNDVMTTLSEGKPIAEALTVGFCGNLLRHIAGKLKIETNYTARD